MITGLNDHLDYGFGVTAETYYNSAKYLDDNKDSIQASQVVEMPINFLYRHSIELALKSLIIIFHKRFDIKYDNDLSDSCKPKIFTGGQWKLLYRCHWIDELYKYWKDYLLIPYQETLKQISQRGDWRECEDVSKAIPIISKYDRNSSFFRYPVTENADFDLEKFTMQSVDIKKLHEILQEKDSEEISNSKKAGEFIMALKNEQDEIFKAYVLQEDLLTELSDSLRRVAYHFYCTHVKTRIELCQGN